MTVLEVPELQTRRLVLRPFDGADAEAFAAMNADPRVMESFPSSLSRAESDTLLGLLRNHLEENGFGLWAVSVPDVAPFIGFVGLSTVHFEAPFMKAEHSARGGPCVELAWRLAFPFWGKGYASEGARASVTFAFESLGLSELVAFTTPENLRSRAVVSALGMQHDADGDFDHPRVPAGHRLSRHVLYRLGRGARGAERSLVDREDALARAVRFAAALDEDAFERARPLLAPDISYEVRGSVLTGKNAVLRSYADATRLARRTFERVAYESAVFASDTGARVHFTDVLGNGDREHRHTSVQHLTIDSVGLVRRIVHEDLPGERERLAAFLAVRAPGE